MTSNTHKSKLGKSIGYLYVEAVCMFISGYIYWLILSRITSTDIIGTSSAVISFSALFTAIAAIGTASGIQRYLAKSTENNKLEESRKIINSSFLLTGSGITITIAAILFFNQSSYTTFNIQQNFISFALVLIILTVIANLLRYIVISSFRTSSITVSTIVSTIIKIVVTVALIAVFDDTISILLGYISYFVASIFILYFATKKSFYYDSKSDMQGLLKKFYNPVKIFKSSVAFWIPNIINTAGTQLGTVVLFIFGAPSEAGIYFICFSIFTGASLIMSVLSTIAYPAIGSLEDGRKRAVSKFIEFTLILVMPVSISILFYPHDILSIFGKDYAKGYSTLQILFFSLFPMVISTGASILSYSNGRNNEVLGIGFASSMPKIVLYVLLVPLFGTIGAAFSFLLGSIIGLAISIPILINGKIRLRWKNILTMALIPLFIVTIFKIFEINFFISFIGTIALSLLLYAKFNIINSTDIEEISKIMPKIIRPLLTIFLKKT